MGKKDKGKHFQRNLIEAAIVFITKGGTVQRCCVQEKTFADRDGARLFFERIIKPKACENIPEEEAIHFDLYLDNGQNETARVHINDASRILDRELDMGALVENACRELTEYNDYLLARTCPTQGAVNDTTN